jgi:hypothetical protein
MRLFVYEHLTAAVAPPGLDPVTDHALLAEGRAMLAALVEDLLAAGHEPWIVWNPALPDPPRASIRLEPCSRLDHRRAIERAARKCPATLLIAPEIDHALLEVSQIVDQIGGARWGPRLELLRLASDKHATCEAWRHAGVPCPAGVAVAAGDPWPASVPLPAIVKPRHGAGALGVVRLHDPARLPAWRAAADLRVEAEVPGLAASVSFLTGPRGLVPLLAGRQRVEWIDDHARYLGGEFPLPSDLNDRAVRLATQALESLGPWGPGWLGVDLILGPDSSGAADRALEINPRLTTSYVGLRRLAIDNLAAALVSTSLGHPTPPTFSSHPLAFSSSGTTTKSG